MIEVKHLSKFYGEHAAVDDLSFEVEDGTIYGFLGANGAGKTTTMNIMAGYLAPSDGEVMINGYSILEEPEKAKKTIGYLPEIPPVYPDMTVYEYLAFASALKKIPPKERENQIDLAVGALELGGVSDRLIRNLSKGYRQRVGIAGTLVGDPKILIFDEPTVGLDPGQIIETRALIRRLGRRHTVILSTHILSEVQAVCDRIVIIDRGRIIADEKTDDISSAVNRSRRYSAKICGPTGEGRSMLRSVPGVSGAEVTGERDLDAFVYMIESEKGRDVRKDLFAACAAKSYPLIGMEPSGMSLEEVFIKLTENGGKKR